ncbi:hypothetical protein ACSAZL_21785 [Methanosarcina sp. T3]|uniref:hypothetical protein n=1 Tax=Methanosarcina sp. T3 TaxID=3439062 RepID=UPI003F842C7D
MCFLDAGCHYWAKSSVESDEFIRENLVIGKREGKKRSRIKSKYRVGVLKV